MAVPSRLPEHLTEQMQRIIRRDTIIIAHFAVTIIFFISLSKESEATWPVSERILSSIIVIISLVFGIFRLRRVSALTKRPLLSVGIWTFLLVFSVLWIADIGSAFNFFILLPIFLTSLYFTKREVYIVYGIFGVAMLLAPVTQHLLLSDSVALATGVPFLSYYNFAISLTEYIAIISISRLIIDTTQISLEDKRAIQEAAKTIEAEKEQIENIISSMNEAVIGVNEALEVVFNNAAAQVLANANTKLVGKKIAETLTLQDTSGNPLEIGSVIAAAEDKPVNASAVLHISDDEAMSVDIVVKPIRMRTEQSSGATHVVLLRDTTEQKTLQVERHDYIALLSHELRTPLAGLEASLSNLNVQVKKSGDDALHKSVDYAYEHTSRLTKVVNQLSQFLKADVDKEGVALEEVVVGEVVQSVVDGFAQAAKQKGLEIHLDAKASDTRTVSSAAHLSNVLSIIMDNAVKFTDKGSINVTISAVDDNLHIAVKDTGQGMPKSQLLKLFNTARQGEEFSTRVHDGVGLSLYYAKRIADQIDAGLTAESELKKGSTFTLILPIAHDVSEK